jgi:hypothetical protein
MATRISRINKYHQLPATHDEDSWKFHRAI